MAETDHSGITDSTVAQLNDDVVSGDPADLATGDDVQGPDPEVWGVERDHAKQEADNAAFAAALEAERQAAAQGEVLVQGPNPADWSDTAKAARGAEDRPDLTDYAGRLEDYFEIQPQTEPVVATDEPEAQTITADDVATVSSVLGESAPDQPGG